jgi:hypothetical protein
VSPEDGPEFFPLTEPLQDVGGLEVRAKDYLRAVMRARRPAMPDAEIAGGVDDLFADETVRRYFIEWQAFSDQLAAERQAVADYLTDPGDPAPRGDALGPDLPPPGVASLG